MPGAELISALFFAEGHHTSPSASSQRPDAKKRLNNPLAVIVQLFVCRLVGNRAPHLGCDLLPAAGVVLAARRAVNRRASESLPPLSMPAVPLPRASRKTL
jgi:hypothetical protein